MTASRDSESCTVLYKILTPAEVEAMPESNWRGTALDLKDSFIHLSSADQLPGTLGRFFNPEFFKGDQLYLLPLPRSNVRPDQRLQFDEAHGQKFGHIYDPIDPKVQFGERITVTRSSSGEWELPALEF